MTKETNIEERKLIDDFGEVQVQVQFFKDIPLQVKLTDGTEEKRYGLPERFIEAMKKAFEDTASEMGAKAEVDVKVMYPSFKFGPEDEVVQIAQKACQKIGRTPKLIKSGGGSDGNVIAGLGIPTVVLGVGYEEIHTTKERIPVKELNKLAEMVLAIIESVNQK